MGGGAWRERVKALGSTRIVRLLMSVLNRYDNAGGALLAGGLAYSALFALVPLALLTAGLTGLLVSDSSGPKPGRHDDRRSPAAAPRPPRSRAR